MSAPSLEQHYAFVTDCVAFPLTPALSLGEREKRLPHGGKLGAHGILQHGKSVNLSSGEGQGEGERFLLLNSSGQESPAHFAPGPGKGTVEKVTGI
jgi:hypothetical protein